MVLTILSSYVSIASIGKFSKLSSFVSKVRPKPKLYLSHSKPPKYSCEEYLSSEALSSDVRRPSRNTTRPADQVRAQRLWTNTAHLLLFSVYARVVYDYDYADLVCVFPPYLLSSLGCGPGSESHIRTSY